MTPPTNVIAVVGPTAGGKTEVGMELARKINAEIISADSMQIYRRMNIGTAKPTPEMMAEVPHHLVDILYPDQNYNAGKFAADADAVIAKLRAQGKNAVLLGGTNLYLKALLRGIIAVPDISDSVKLEVQHIIERQGLSGAYEKLSWLDRESAQKLNPNDISRITRALEVVLETGKSIHYLQQKHAFRQQRYKTFFIAVDWPRKILYARINQRVLQMVKKGLIEEAEDLLAQGYSPDLRPLRSIGYKQAFMYLGKQFTQEEMIADIQQKTRRYAKKQLTWNRKDKRLRRLEGDKLDADTLQSAERFLYED